MHNVLENALSAGDAKEVQRGIFELGLDRDAQGIVRDEVAFYVIDILRRAETKASPVAGHVLNFFEFEWPQLSKRAKDRCMAFLREWGDDFTHVHARQVVAELRVGTYRKT